MPEHDPYRELYDEIVSEWNSTEDALYRQYYPETNTKETH